MLRKSIRNWNSSLELILLKDILIDKPRYFFVLPVDTNIKRTENNVIDWNGTEAVGDLFQ